MSLRSNISAEWKRSPIATSAVVVGVIVAILTLYIAWMQYIILYTAPAESHNASMDFHWPGIKLRNLSVTISFFLAATFSSALLVRVVWRFHAFAAFLLSIPIAVISGFLSVLVLYLAAPKPITFQTLNTAAGAVSWGTFIIYAAINGLSVLNPLFSSLSKDSISKESNDEISSRGSGLLTIVIMLSIGWGMLVSSGISKLVTIFLGQESS